MNLQKLKEEQIRLAEKVITTDHLEKVDYIAGCDQSYNDNKIHSVVVVIDAKTMKVVDTASAEQACRLPYISGFMFYREAHAIIEAFSRLKIRPDLLLVDADGILHPRRIGMASHLGIVLDVPTIGVAKTQTCGKNIGGKIEIDKEIRAEEVVTREFARPVIISPGHKISLRTAVEHVRNMTIHPHKLPEPLHIAHRLAKKSSKDSKKEDSKENTDS